MDLTTALRHTFSQNQSERDEGTRVLELMSEQDYGTFLALLCQEMANEGRDVHLRMAAGLSVKNSLVAKDEERHGKQVGRWTGLDASVRRQAKEICLECLKTGQAQVGTVAAQAVSAIAFIELPRGEWPDLVPVLLGNVTGGGANAGLRKASLEALGFICEEIEPEVLSASSAQILTAVVNGLRKEEAVPAVRLAAAKALLAALTFIQRHVESPNEAPIIVQTICEAASAPGDEALSVAAFECLNDLVQLYYAHLGSFLGSGVAQMAIQILAERERWPDAVLLQAVEFWSGLGEIERELEAQCRDDEDEAASDSLHVVRRFVSDLLPPLLALLEQQPGEDVTDEWCPSMAAATCLGLVAETLSDQIMQQHAVISFIDRNLSGTTWRAREAGVMALGSLLDGPSDEAVVSLVQAQLSRLVELLANDPSVAVQDSAAWALGRICDFHLAVVPDAHISILLQVLQHCLAYAPRVAVNCAWSLLTLCTHLGSEDGSVETSPVSPAFEGLAQALLAAADRLDADEAGLRSAAYQALAGLLLHAPMDRLQAVKAAQGLALVRLQHATASLQTSVVNADDLNRLLTLAAHLCALLQAAVRKTGLPDQVTTDALFSCMHALLPGSSSAGSSAELEDVLLLAGVLLGEMDAPTAARYCPAILPGLLVALQRHEESQMCAVAVGVVGDLARALGPGLQPHAPALMERLLAGIASSSLNRAVKPHIIAALGDICLALGPAAFLPFLSATMAILLQASAIAPPPADSHDYDELDWVAALRESLLEAFTCLVQTLRVDSPAGPALVPYIQPISVFLEAIAKDPERSEAMVRSLAGLLGDLADSFGPQAKAALKAAPWVMAFFSAPLPTKQEMSPQTAQVLQWANQILA